MKLYILPVTYACNSNCTFCITKANAKEKGLLNLPKEMNMTRFQESIQIVKSKIPIEKIEVTGGGEPFLCNNLTEMLPLLRNLFPETYIKLYTNGFVLKEITGIDELNISRAHWDSDINYKFFRSQQQNDLQDVLKYYRSQVKYLRVSIPMLKGAIDKPSDLETMIDKMGYLVDQFVVRDLFEGTKNHLDYCNFNFNHPKVKIETTDVVENYNLVIPSDGNLYNKWDFRKENLWVG